MIRRTRALPLWLWLVMALAALAGFPVLATWGFSQASTRWQQQAAASQLAGVRRTIGTDVTRWSDPAWQRAAGIVFAGYRVDVGLVDGSGRLIYATDGARPFLGAFPPASPPAYKQDRSAPAGSPASPGTGKPVLSRPPGQDKLAALTSSAAQSLSFQEIVITPNHRNKLVDHPALALPARAYGLLGIGFLFAHAPPDVPPAWLPQLAGFVALLLALVLVTWALVLLVLRPLAAMSRAAQQIAGGEWDIHLPGSRAREVAEVSSALAGMSVALQGALARQGALEEERRLFIGAIAHDLRTPLFALRGYLKGLESGVVTTPERVAHYVRACSVRAEALEQLIAGLFAYTQIEYLDQEPRREPLELGDLLAACAEALHPAASGKGIALVLDGPPAPCPFAGERALLERAVQNLLENAVRHTPPGGRVSVRWTRDGGFLIFKVEDTGTGIAPDVLPHLFTPLYRGEPSRNRQTGGAGLGLTIARRIMRVHGGDLVAANGAAGGAVFTGTLPVEQSAPESAAGYTERR